MTQQRADDDPGIDPAAAQATLEIDVSELRMTEPRDQGQRNRMRDVRADERWPRNRIG
jgi:hypothetical protein